MRILDRLIRSSPAISLLATGQKKTFVEFKARLQSNIDYVAVQPAGYVVETIDGLSMDMDTWLADAATEMAALDVQIADLDRYV